MATLRTGYTTGTCAAAAAKAAATLLSGAPAPETVEITLPDGTRASFPVVSCRHAGDACEAAVRKDAGDDPDVTDQACVIASVTFTESDDVVFAAGEGVGIVTKPGLSVPVGEPAINPVPRQMIRAAVREVTDRSMRVTISIPGGRELAARTFNPRLGVEGGLSIIGTTGRVRPFSVPALCEALKCALDVAAASGVTAPVLVPGNIGERAARRHFRPGPEQVIQVSNHWGFMLDQLARHSFAQLLIVGHPGKLAKLAGGDWDTHSSRSANVTANVTRLAETTLGERVAETPTVEGIFDALPQGKRRRLADALAARVRQAIAGRSGSRLALAVVLVNMSGDILGADGDLTAWQ